jgi:cytochrome P450
MGTRARPPGPPGRFLTGHLGELRRDTLGLFTRCAREYGDCVLLRYGLTPVYLLFHPDLIEQVLHSRNFIKHYALRMNRRLLGNGLLSSEGDFWLRQRRLIQPAFLRDRIPGHATAMVEQAERLADTWADGQTRNVYADMRQLTLEIAARTLFGADASGQGQVVYEALRAVMDSFNSRLFSVLRLPESFPTLGNLRAGRAVRRLNAILYKIIEQARSSGRQDDLLSILLHARDEQDGTGMTDQQLRDEAMTLFLAGHDTTALALSWTWYLLAQHPEVVAPLEAELRAVLAGRAPGAADLPRLRYTEMVIQEVMRLYPPAYALGRQAIEACDIGGYHLPAGGTVVMPQWVVHRDPRFWDDPERFHPARWANELATRPRYAYFPFGGGPRVCIGNTFAMMEAVLLLATLARRYRMRLVPGPPVRPKPRLTLAPDRGIEVVLEKVG